MVGLHSAIGVTMDRNRYQTAQTEMWEAASISTRSWGLCTVCSLGSAAFSITGAAWG